MDSLEEKPLQETTSIYFNTIIRGHVSPLTIDDLPARVIDEFNEKIRQSFSDDADAAIKRVRYLIPYILQSIDWNEYGMPLEAWQLQYYYRRDRFMDKTHLCYETFLAHVPLQRAIDALGLDAEPTFEFILFLKYYYGLRAELRYSSIEQLAMAQQALSELDNGGEASLDISVSGKHFRFGNTGFIKAAIALIDRNKLEFGAFANDFTEGGSRDKLRAIDYYMVKTLLDFLPIKRKGNRRGQFLQDERNLGLSVLNLCGRLPDVDREGVCSRENNATFDKLMRDFKNARIPFCMELFL